MVLFQLLLIFLVPVTIYCLFLGSLNRRWNPVMISGVWDCLGLYFALSGFFLAVVPAMLHQLYVKSVRSLVFDGNAKNGDDFQGVWFDWVGIWLIYYVLLLAGAAFVLWTRRRKTVVYNVEPEAFARVFGVVLGRLGLGMTHSGSLNVIGPALEAASTEVLHSEAIAEGTPSPVQPASPLDGPPALVRIDTFPALANVTLHWRSQAPELRGQIETELARALKEVETQHNPAGNWLMGIGGILLGVVFLIVVLLLLLAYFPPRRW